MLSCGTLRIVPLNLFQMIMKIAAFIFLVVVFVSVCHLQPNQISMDENILVSRYINNPLLIDGELLFAT